MGVDENAAIIRRGYEAFNSGDMNTLTELFDESAVWHTPGRSSLAGDHEGREATFAYFGRLGQETGGTLRAGLQHCLQTMTSGWSAFSATPRSATASTWLLTRFWSSSSRTAGLLRVGTVCAASSSLPS